jgi:hypothetical protein
MLPFQIRDFPDNKMPDFLIFYITFILLAISFYLNQGFDIFLDNHFYPVTVHDYLIVIFSFFAIKVNPLTCNQLKNIIYIFSINPIILFLNYFQYFSFNQRSNMGFGNPNWLGLYTAICIPIIILCIIHNRSQLKKKIVIPVQIILLISLVLTVLMLLASGSRSALLVTFFNLGLFSLYFLREKIILQFKRLRIIVGSFLLFILLYATQNILNESRFSALNRFFDVWNDSNQKRVEIYNCFFSLGVEKFFSGWSPENTAIICEARLNFLPGEVNHAHNFLLQTFADHGIIFPVLILYLLMTTMIVPFYKYKTKINHENDRNSYILYALFFSSITIILVSLFQSAFYHEPLFPLWLGLSWGSQHNLLENISKSRT